MKPAPDRQTPGSATPRGAGRHGFSLLEVMIAVTIFALISVSLYSTFRSGLKAYEIGMRASDMLQTGRFAMDIMARDVKNVFLIPETAYNMQYRTRRASVEGLFRRTDRDMLDPRYLADTVEHFNRTGIGLDLSFTGHGDESSARLTFVRYQPPDEARPSHPINLARVTYSLDGDRLIRTQEDIFIPSMRPDGEIAPRPRPHPEILTEGVRAFTVLYGYYYDGQWRETREWQSKSRNKRIDNVDISRVDEDWQEPFQFVVNSWLEQLPDDNLPSYMRLRIEVDDPQGRGRTRVFERTLNIVNASDSHVPIPEHFSVETREGDQRRFDRGGLVGGRRDSLRARRERTPAVDERERLGGGGFILGR